MKILNFFKNHQKNKLLKYELTSETKDVDGHTLHRIKYLRNGDNFVKGQLGGWIESEENLSQEGECCVMHEAVVYGDAWITDDAKVGEYAAVCDKAVVEKEACIYDTATVCDDAWITDGALITGDSLVSESALIAEKAHLAGNCVVTGFANIAGDSYIGGHAKIHGSVEIENASINDHADISGDFSMVGPTHITGDAVITKESDYLVMKNNWSSGRYFTWTRSNDKWSVGCFYGTGEELIKKAYEDSENIGKHYEAAVQYVEHLKELDKE